MLKIIKPFKYAYRGVDVVEYKPGAADIPDGDECEKIALENEWVKRVKGSATADASETKKPVGPALSEAIAAAIPDLDESEDFTVSGVPSVPALTRALGYDISGAERDAAWMAYQEQKAPAKDPGGKAGQLNV